jgi:hypothetical protein
MQDIFFFLGLVTALVIGNIMGKYTMMKRAPMAMVVKQREHEPFTVFGTQDAVHAVASCLSYANDMHRALKTIAAGETSAEVMVELANEALKGDIND